MNKAFFKAILLLSLLLLFSCNQNLNTWQSYSGDKEIERKVDSLLSIMTLEEKIGQMSQFSSDGDITGPSFKGNVGAYVKQGMVGSIFNAVTLDGIKNLQYLALSESRLKIPILFGYDVVHGFKTIFPMPLAESCSWDLELMNKSASIAAEEASSVGINWTFAPMVDIARDARWGRVMEGAGEDPYLGSLIAAARVKGFQGGDQWTDLQKINTVLACAKHFAAYGAAESGRDYNTVDISERTLYETYLPPFKAAKDAGVATFMTAFNEIAGVPCTASKYLYTDILRKEWAFNGFVVTDFTAINELVAHGIAKDQKQAGELSVNAGIDMDMTGSVFLKNLEQLVKEGKVSEATIDNAVRHILEMKFILGLFDNPYKYIDEERTKNTILKPAFLETARDAVRKSAVLLKNEDAYFPIDKNKALTVALIGPMMKEKRSLNDEWGGRGERDKSITLFEGLTEKYKDSKVRFIYAEGCDLTTDNQSGFKQAIAAAQQADIVLVAMGESYHWSGEAASRTDIKLPVSQQSLLKELKKLNKKIGLVLINGRPLDLSWEDENIEAILEAWYPGTMAGHGIADIIGGDYNPSGKLTMSFPRNVGQLPIYYNRKNTGRPIDPANPKVDYRSFYLDVENSPLYPFGYGLSYTSFEIKNMKMDKETLRTGQKLIITADVSNSGKVDGEETVQLYIRDLYANVTRPVKELKGFKKVLLKKGETKQVTFELTENDLAFYNADMSFKAEVGEFNVWVASSSADNSNEMTFSFE